MIYISTGGNKKQTAFKKNGLNNKLEKPNFDYNSFKLQSFFPATVGIFIFISFYFLFIKEDNNSREFALIPDLPEVYVRIIEYENTNKLSEQKKAIELAINQWASAWSSKDVEGYISSYADDFKPSRGLSKNKWEKQRRERLANPAFIKITLVNLNIEINDNGYAKIRFKQEYKSDTYSDEVEKEITVMMFKDKWLITRERVR